LSGSLTGAGRLMLGSNSLTFSGASSVDIVHGAGVLTAVTVTGFILGARIQVFNVTDGIELYNDIPSTALLRLNYNWSTNKTVRCRMARVNVLDADATIEQVGLITSSGAAFLLQPTPDVVYEANAIDGATVTEFVADYPNVQIDVVDSDGVTTPQRGYAWYMASMMTAQGIATYYNAITAEDELNYRINVAIVDIRVQNVGLLPCVISGARLYRSDGTSIFAAGTAPIQADPGRAFLAQGQVPQIAAAVLSAAQAAPVHADIRQVNGVTIVGTGTPDTDPWRPA